MIYVLLVAAAWGYAQVFGGRAAYIHVGALIGTIMVWNVFFQIIPGQKQMVAEIRAGKDPDPTPGIIGKQRSVHNTYFTLPVLFIMISNHYPMTYGSKHGWAILAVIMLAGALIRQYFVLRHVGKNLVALPAVATVLLLGLAIAMAPKPAATGAAVRRGEDHHFRAGAAGPQGALHGLPLGEADLRRLRAAAGRARCSTRRSR